MSLIVVKLAKDFLLYQHMLKISQISVADPEGIQVVHLNPLPPPPPFFRYPMKMKYFGQWDQIISFSWDI